MPSIIKYLLPVLLGAVLTVARAAPADDVVRPIQDQWAEIKYRSPEKQQAEQYQALAEKSRKLVEANPGAAGPLIWEGIVLSSEAGARGGLGALSLVKEARQRLEEAIKLNDKALDRSAYTSLATLYAKVPEAMREPWRRATDRYLRERPGLRGPVLIVDSRHTLKEFDQRMPG